MSSWNGLRQKMPDVFDFHLGLNRMGRSPHFEHKTSCITLCREGAPAPRFPASGSSSDIEPHRV